MAEFPAIPIFTDAFISDTTHLTAAQTGAYIMLLMTAWRTKENALPDDDDFLARCSRLDKRTFVKQKSIIMRFWSLDSSHLWRQGRLDDERKRADEQRIKNAKAGKASALKRKGRHSTCVQPKSNESPTPSPSPTVDIERVAEDKILNNILFEEFWNLYPLKSSREDSRKEYASAIEKGTAHETIINGVKLYAESVRGSSQRFIKDPPNWLRGEKWNDKPIDRSEKGKPTNGRTAYSDTIKSATITALDNLREQEKVRAQNN